MSVQFYNTLTKTVEPFHSIETSIVRMYTCGPTVYDYLHVGNWAAYIYWDIVVRTLEAYDFSVERVMNITDVGHLVSDEDTGEDKLEKGARRENKTAWDVAAFYTDDFLQGMRRLHLLSPKHITKATDFITEQLELVRELQKKGYTYQINDGIYFDTATFPTYANFAELDLKAQQAGARVAFNDEKRNPSDFALWKFSPKNETRDMEWKTPLDLLENTSDEVIMGFPGWHLECSAMAMSLLGSTLDIHTGGIDHIPVHHTNEIAQSESASGQRFSNTWLHNNHLKVNGTKISKSLGNGYTLNDLEKRDIPLMAYKLFVLQSHYQSEGNFTFENLEAASKRLDHWRSSAALRHQIHDTIRNTLKPEERSLYGASRALIELLGNNLDTPGALRHIDEVFNHIASIHISAINRHELLTFLETVDELLGLELLTSTPDIDDALKQRIVERERARDNKDWVRSDELRKEIEDHGIAIRDTSDGTIWSYPV